MDTKRIYAEEWQTKRYKEYAEHNYYNITSPTIETVTNGIILPAQKYKNEDDLTCFKGGVVDENNRFCENSKHIHEFGTELGSLKSAYEFDKNKLEIRNEKVIYGGILYKHFGHFLIEGTSRLWCAVSSEEKLPVAFILEDNKTIAPQNLQFLEYLGITGDRLLLITKPTKFDEVVVPEQSGVIQGYYTDKFLLPFQAVTDKIQAKSEDRIYFSRRKFKGSIQLIGEEKLEKVFKDNGYKIIYPEKISLEEQVAYVKGAKEIACVMGTAAHLALFANRGIKSIILERTEHINREQLLINQAKELNWFSVSANMNYLPVGHEFSPILMGITENFAEFLTNHNYKFDIKQVNKISDRNIRKFNQAWFSRFSSKKHNPLIWGIEDIYAKRVGKYCTTAFLSLRQRVFLKRTEGAYRVYTILGFTFKVRRRK